MDPLQEVAVWRLSERRDNRDIWNGHVSREIARSIVVIEDLDATEAEHRFRSTASLLDPLSAPQLSLFRRAVRTGYQSGNARLLCGKCGKPVYVSLSGAGDAEERDGRDAFFAHHAGTAEDCEWGTGGADPRDIDRLKYGGATEGVQHQRLKVMLAGMLEADPVFRNVQVEHVISRPPHWRKPDVAATFLGGLVAFDLQLATTQLPAIVAREDFYESHGIRYVWVTSTDDAGNLARQAFQDIYWNNDAQIFGIDERAEAATLESGELHLRVLSVAPRLSKDGIHAVWERHLVHRDEIDWNTPSGRPRFPGADFDTAVKELIESRFSIPRQRLVNAAKRPENAAFLEAGQAWDEIARTIGAPDWSRTEPYRAFKAIGVLATAAAGKKMDSSGFAPEQLTSIFNDLLETQACRGWTTALQHIAATHGHGELLEVPSTQKKILRNKAEQHPDLHRHYAGMLDIIFPKSARSRLSGPPTEIEEIQSIR